MTKDDARHGHRKLRWHPAFLQAMQAELFDYREYLEFKPEFPLTAAPLQIDLLIIKKPKELAIDKNIARIFRSDNLLEYKSPEDYLSVKDFWKVCSYANLYAAITPGVDLSDVTISFVESRHPPQTAELPGQHARLHGAGNFAGDLPCLGGLHSHPDHRIAKAVRKRKPVAGIAAGRRLERKQP